MDVIIHVDGGSRGNPGPAGAGFIIRSADDQTSLAEVGVFIDRATNNVAEYTALLEALRRAHTLGAKNVSVLSDSELMVRQMNGQYRVKNEGLKPLFADASQLAGGFARFSIQHIPREQNQDADAMANKAMNLKRTIEE